MSDIGPPSTKRMRSNISTIDQSKTNRYMLRSQGNLLSRCISIEMLQSNRKRKLSKQLMDLSSECILAIFTYIDVYTLANVAETCVRMYDLARYQFKMQYNNFSLKWTPTNGLRTVDFESVLRNFGDLITSLQIESLNVNYNTIASLLLLIKQYCPFLRSLSLIGIIIRRDLANTLIPLFNTIECLKIKRVSFNDCNFGPMKNLKILEMICVECDLWSDFLWKNFPKLKKVRVVGVSLSNESIVGFLNLNPQLMQLSFIYCDLSSTAVFRSIAKLEHLKIFESFNYLDDLQTDERFESDLIYLSSLKNLQILNLDCSNYSVKCLVENFIANGIQLEQLVLSYGQGNDGIYDLIAKLNTLKILQLNNMEDLNDEHIISFAQELKCLEHFYLRTEANLSPYGLTQVIRAANRLTHLKIDLKDFLFTDKLYNDILRIVTNREENIKLEIMIYTNGQVALLPLKTTMETNKQWLTVKQLDKSKGFCMFVFDYDYDYDIIILPE